MTSPDLTDVPDLKDVLDQWYQPHPLLLRCWDRPAWEGGGDGLHRGCGGVHRTSLQQPDPHTDGGGPREVRGAPSGVRPHSGQGLIGGQGADLRFGEKKNSMRGTLEI